MKNLKIFTFLICVFHFWSFVFGFVSAQSPTPEATSAARQFIEANREKVKSDQSEDRRRAFVGTLKSISNSTLTLETKGGVKQAKTSTESAIIRTNKTTSKEIKFEDIAIGDLTITMGYLTENDVLDAKRIIVSETPEKSITRKAIYGTVQEIDLKKKTIELKQIKDSKVIILTINSKTKISGKEELEEIEPGDRLIATCASETDADTLTATRLHVL